MINNDKTGKLNNSGFSLVELIIAISIGAIVAGAVAALMSFAIRNYRDQSANADMQFELQTSLNQMMDEIMSSTGMVIVQNGGTPGDPADEPYTQYAVFGNFSANVSGSKGFEGVIFAAGPKDSDGRFKIYMNRVSMATTDAPDVVAANLYSTLSGSFATDPNPYLLSMNATRFDLIPDPDNKWINNAAVWTDVAKRKYINPIEVKIDLQFEKDATQKVIHKHVEDVAYMRNKVVDSVFVDGDSDGTLDEYKLKKEE